MVVGVGVGAGLGGAGGVGDDGGLEALVELPPQEQITAERRRTRAGNKVGSRFDLAGKLIGAA
jgi:hypothetical protein